MSDNAKTFRATEKALKRLFDHPRVQGELERTKTEWRFNLERASWWGGFFERIVGCVKACLKRVLGNAKLTFDELLTVVTEIEGTLNSRPLTYAYDELDEDVLTPSHLIYGRRIKSLPDENVEEEEEHETACSKRFRHVALRLTHFWNRWRREYLTDLREFHKGMRSEERKPLEIRDVVIVFEANKKRALWKTAIVERLIKGRDGIVRGADVRVIAKGKHLRISRPIQKLYSIEVRATLESAQGVKEKELASESQHRRRNPTRAAAALDAAWKTQHMVA